jgi:hypothetical protein
VLVLRTMGERQADLAALCMRDLGVSWSSARPTNTLERSIWRYKCTAVVGAEKGAEPSRNDNTGGIESENWVGI